MPGTHSRVRDVVRAHLAEANRLLASRDLDALVDLFEPDAVLIGTAGRATDLRAYLSAVVEQGVLQWRFVDDLLAVDGTGDIIWYAAGGDAVLGDEHVPQFRMTGVLRRSPEGRWRWSQFHGSVPASS